MLLGEPTCYSEVLQYAARDAARAGAEVEYTVILIITDGGVSDMEVSIVYTVYTVTQSIIHTVYCLHQETKRVLVELSRQPVSVVVVGVGRGDMSSLVTLDSDRARLSAGEDQAARDIVQFVGRM